MPSYITLANGTYIVPVQHHRGNMLKDHRMPNHPFAGRIQGYLDRLQQQRVEFLDPNSRKRSAPVEPTDGLDQNKRQRLGADMPSVPAQFQVPPLPPGPVSIAQLFTLTQEESRKSFDVQAIPVELVSRIVVPLLASVDPIQLNNAIDVCFSMNLRHLIFNTSNFRCNRVTDSLHHARLFEHAYKT